MCTVEDEGLLVRLLWESLRATAYLEVFSELHDVGHVNFVEGSQHGICVLSTLEALSYTRSQPGDLHPPLGPLRLTPLLVQRG